MTGGGTSIPLAYNLAQYVETTLWPGLTHASAIDSTGRLFVTDGKVVYAVIDGVASVYLNAEELKTMTPTMGQQILSLDVGPDDRLYILEGGYPHSILVSSGPHAVAVHMTLGAADAMFPTCMGVESPNRIMIMTMVGGLYAVTPEGATQIYDDTVVMSDSACFTVDFVVSQDGQFYYSAGCLKSPLLAGKTDGSGVGVVKTVYDFEKVLVFSFAGLARPAGGGAVINFEDKALYIDTSGKTTELSMNPPMTDFEDGMSGLPVFRTNAIEVGPSGDIYFINGQSIYRATPQ